VDALRVRILGSGTSQMSNDGREIQFDMAPNVILHRPIFGYGGAQGAEALGYRSPGGQLTIDSYILSIVLDYGIIGFICYYGAIATAAYLTLKWAISSSQPSPNDRNAQEQDYLFPLGVMLVQFYVIKTVLSQEENHSILFLIFGAIFALRKRISDAAKIPKAQ
jgi:O-antigen ligase